MGLCRGRNSKPEYTFRSWIRPEMRPGGQFQYSILYVKIMYATMRVREAAEHAHDALLHANSRRIVVRKNWLVRSSPSEQTLSMLMYEKCPYQPLCTTCLMSGAGS